MGVLPCEDVREQEEQGVEPGAPRHGAGTPHQGTASHAAVWARGSNEVPPGTRGDAQGAQPGQQGMGPGTGPWSRQNGAPGLKDGVPDAGLGGHSQGK